jgi:hypothetical protein
MARLPPNFFVHHIIPAVGHAIFDFITTRDAVQVRSCSRDCRDAVAAHKWHDRRTFVRRHLRRWRACFPRATAACIGIVSTPGCWRLMGADMVHLKGVTELKLRTCIITDRGLSRLRGIRTLDISGCNLGTVTDAAFAHLRGIRSLKMSYCKQATITDAAFAHLEGIRELDMSGCSQATITDAAFARLRGIHTLDMSGCSQATITDAAFAHLAGIHTLDMRRCNQRTITNAAFVHLRGIRVLRTRQCTQLNREGWSELFGSKRRRRRT